MDGKKLVQAQTVLSYQDGTVTLRNWEGQSFTYADVQW